MAKTRAEKNILRNDFVLVPLEVFIHKLGIAKSTLYLWRKKGWVVPGRHFLKIGKTVLYFLDEDRLREVHEISNQGPVGVRAHPVKSSGQRVNWNY